MLTQVDNHGDQRALLTDFGIARDVNDIGGLTQTNMTVGTVAYSAPEQLKGESIDGRADQYALTTTAYQLLTGAQLFPLTNPAAVVSAHLVSPPPSLNAHRSDLDGLDPVLATALAKNAEQRFHRCSDFAEALRRQLGDARSARSAAAATTAPRSSAAPRTQSKDWTGPPSHVRPASRTPINRRRAAVATAVALAVVIGVSLSLWRPWSGQTRDCPVDYDRSHRRTYSTAAEPGAGHYPASAASHPADTARRHTNQLRRSRRGPQSDRHSAPVSRRRPAISQRSRRRRIPTTSAASTGNWPSARVRNWPVGPACSARSRDAPQR